VNTKLPKSDFIVRPALIPGLLLPVKPHRLSVHNVRGRLYSLWNATLLKQI